MRVRDLQRLAPDVLAGVLPRLYPQMLDLAYATRTRAGRSCICTAASQEMADLLAIVLTFDGAVGLAARRSSTAQYTGRPGGPFTYREGKARGDPRAGRGRGHRPRRARGPTRTRSPTCRCCARSATRWRSTRTATLARVAREEGWEILRFERLNRRLRFAGALVGAAALGGAGSLVARRAASREPS